jgi:hypothetical protein
VCGWDRSQAAPARPPAEEKGDIHHFAEEKGEEKGDIHHFVGEEKGDIHHFVEMMNVPFFLPIISLK